MGCCPGIVGVQRGLGDIADDFAQLVTDMQAEGRTWLYDRIRELTGLGVGFQRLATQTDALGRPDVSAELRDKARQVREVADGLYWVVDTYAGGIDALPNVIPVRGRRPGVQYLEPAPRGRDRVALGVLAPAVAGLALKALGILTAAALVAYISSVAGDYAVRVRQVEAAQANNNPDLLPEPEKGPIEQTADLVGKVTLGIGAFLVWVNRDRIFGAARNLGRRREA